MEGVETFWGEPGTGKQPVGDGMAVLFRDINELWEGHLLSRKDLQANAAS